jgi:ribose transport system substrate-binding protein
MKLIQQSKVLLGSVALILAAGGCPKETATPSGGTGEGSGTIVGGGGSHINIAVIPKGTSHSFWLAVKAGADAAGKEDNATIDWGGPSDETEVEAQIRIVENAITRRVSAIVMAACDSTALIPSVKKALDAKIPVIMIDSGLSEDISTAVLSTDNVEGGKAGAKALAEAMGGKGKVGLIAFIKGAASSDDREKGFVEGAKGIPGLDLSGRTVYSDSKVDKALDLTKAFFTSTPDIGGIFAANQSAGEGAIAAIKQAGKAGKVKLVCYDASEGEIAALKEGTVDALIVQNPYRMGYEGVKTALKAIKGEKIEPRKIDTGVQTVTKANLDTPEIQKLLNPAK